MEDLRQRLFVNYEDMGTMLLWRGVAGLFGSMFGGFIIEKFRSKVKWFVIGTFGLSSLCSMVVAASRIKIVVTMFNSLYGLVGGFGSTGMKRRCF